MEEASELRRELLDQQSQRALMASDGANELEKLRDQLVRLRDESEASERKLMGQLTERSAALATTFAMYPRTISVVSSPSPWKNCCTLRSEVNNSQ